MRGGAQPSLGKGQNQWSRGRRKAGFLPCISLFGDRILTILKTLCADDLQSRCHDQISLRLLHRKMVVFCDRGQEMGHHYLWPECCLEFITGRPREEAGKGSLRTPLAVVKLENHPSHPRKGTTVNTGTHKHQHTYIQTHSSHTEVLVSHRP